MGKVLIIDDSEFDRRMMRRAIAASDLNRDFQFTELDYGDTAIETIARETPTLTILDIRMPMIDGFQILNRIRAREDIGDQTVIMVSGSDERADRELAIKAGANGYFVKPSHAADYLKLGQEICEAYMPSDGT